MEKMKTTKKRGPKKGTSFTTGMKLSKLIKVCESIGKKEAENIVIPVSRRWLENSAVSIGLAWLQGNFEDVEIPVCPEDEIKSSEDEIKSSEDEIKSSEDKIEFKVINHGV